MSPRRRSAKASEKITQIILESETSSETESDTSDEEYIPEKEKESRKIEKIETHEKEENDEKEPTEELSDPIIIEFSTNEEESHEEPIEENENENEPMEENEEPQITHQNPQNQITHQNPLPLQNIQINPLTPLNAIPLDTLIPGSQVYKYVGQSLKNIKFPALYVHEVMYLQQYYQQTSQIPQSIKLMIEEKENDSCLPKGLSILLHNLMMRLSSVKREFKHIQQTEEYQSNPDVQRREFNIYAKEMFKCKYNMWNTFFTGQVPNEFNEAKQYHLSMKSNGPTGNDESVTYEYLEILYKKLPKGLRLYIPRYAYRAIRFE